nr:unnamed protein product [Digitaria exilis]
MARRLSHRPASSFFPAFELQTAATPTNTQALEQYFQFQNACLPECQHVRALRAYLRRGAAVSVSPSPPGLLAPEPGVQIAR